MNNLEELKEIAKLPSWRVNEALQVYITKLEQNEPNRGNFEPNKYKRTSKQNDSIHLYCKLVAEALNNGGWSIPKLLSEKVSMDVDWDTISVKNIIWRQFQKAVLHKKSTTELSKQGDIDKVYDHINRFLTNPKKPLISEPIPFPSQTVIDQTSDAYTAHRKLVNSEDYPENNLEPTF